MYQWTNPGECCGCGSIWTLNQSGDIGWEVRNRKAGWEYKQRRWKYRRLRIKRVGA